MKQLNGPRLIEWYQHGDYIVEVEEVNDPTVGLMWNFWIHGKNNGIKSFMFGWPADQTQAYEDPKMWTKEEAIDLMEENLEDEISFYEEMLYRLNNVM